MPEDTTPQFYSPEQVDRIINEMKTLGEQCANDAIKGTATAVTDAFSRKLNEMGSEEAPATGEIQVQFTTPKSCEAMQNYKRGR